MLENESFTLEDTKLKEMVGKRLASLRKQAKMRQTDVAAARGASVCLVNTNWTATN